MKHTLLVMLTFFALQPFMAKAAPCPNVQSTYDANPDVGRFKIILSFNFFGRSYALATTEQIYKGCLGINAPVLVVDDTGLIGNGRYLLNGTATSGNFKVQACGATKFSTLTANDVNWLKTRYNCCGASCQCGDGSQPVNCTIDPCSITTCSDTTICQANYCGGCTAEFFTETGERICTPCTQNSDCAANQQCLGDQCHSICSSDADCDSEHYCLSIYHTCIPWRQIGERCGDKYGYHRCAPELTCIIPYPWLPYDGVCQ